VEEKEELPTRKQVIKYLTDQYQTQALIPQMKPCMLPSLGLKIEVPVNPFLGCLFSLLTSPD